MTIATRVKKIIAMEWLLLLLIPAFFLVLLGLSFVSETVNHMGWELGCLLIFGPYILIQLARVTIWSVRTVKGGE